MAVKKITVLIILDGWGIAKPNAKSNPISAKTAPNYFSWLKKYPNTTIEASGEAVGLFKGQEGNSEAGHLNIGAGRVVKQDALYISDAIKDGTFFKNSAFEHALHHVKKYKTAVHVMGLLSNHNSAHSCPEHLYALLDLLNQQLIAKVYLHLFTDGRDSGQHDAPMHLRHLRTHLHGTEKIATVMGRLYGMDRNKNWDRTKTAYEAMVQGAGLQADSVEAAITEGYNRGETDEYLLPTVIMNGDQPVATIKNNDAIIYFNLRSDRARQLTKAFVQPNFEKNNPGAFKRKHLPRNIRFVAMTDFGPDLPNVLAAFPSRDVVNSLNQLLCPRRQLYLAESEKFAHITYFLNGGYAQHFCDEQWVKIESDKIKDFTECPEMKSADVANFAVKAIAGRRFEFIAINFANTDMIGHTGNLAAGQKAVAAVDAALGRIYKAVLKFGAQMVITADHGNVEEMLNAKTKELDTEHSSNPVPFIIVCSSPAARCARLNTRKRLKTGGKLADVAPTILKLMGIKPPKEMTGKPLF